LPSDSGRSCGNFGRSWKPKKGYSDEPGLPVPVGLCPLPTEFTDRVPRHHFSTGIIRLFLSGVLVAAVSQRAMAAILQLIAPCLPTPVANTGANGQETWPGIKAFGDGDLSLARGHDVGRGDGPERPVPTGQSPAIRRIVYAGAGLGRLVTMIERVSGVRDQAAFRQ
jgi:hypothetical protein